MSTDHRLGTPSAGGDGVTAVSYLLAGVIFYGALGWLADHLLHTGAFLPVGLVLGAAAAVYLIIKRFGDDE
ncbi:hypothetical protein [uncultured Propionibacterium sp.]|uniref:AtpZ/AtpI family protein n=1 Tax=uncultured Propionibacterium sp. TaxID=218066 RepID=UPI00292D93EB|nr:hypothetical protein [uncultured Propionibacterium sp.]